MLSRLNGGRQGTASVGAISILMADRYLASRSATMMSARILHIQVLDNMNSPMGMSFYITVGGGYAELKTPYVTPSGSNRLDCALINDQRNKCLCFPFWLSAYLLLSFDRETSAVRDLLLLDDADLSTPAFGVKSAYHRKRILDAITRIEQ